jgi:enoyl-CoA hydratase/carnithine racemase
VLDVTTDDGVTLLRMQDGENRFNLPFLHALEQVLGAAAAEGRSLVLTGDGKFFSNGLDLDWLSSAPPDEAAECFAVLHRVLATVLAFPGHTVAAINGHAFGGGAILAAAADVRIMRSDRGYFCFPEVDLGMAMSPQFDALLQARYPRQVLLTALLSGQRHTAPEALAATLIDSVATEDDLVPAALTRARTLSEKDGPTIGTIKASLYRPHLAVLAG